jgi:uncharacterized protein (TIGR02147 family)
MDYLDYRQFLRDRLEHLAARDRKFSQRWVAKRAGFKAPQLLSMILQGQRNLTRDKAHDLATVLKLTVPEREYFLLIVEMAECSTHEQQKLLLDKIRILFKDGPFVPLDDDQAILFKEWYYPAIREIVTLRDAPKGEAEYPAWIAERLGISLEQAEEGLEILLAKRLLKVEDGLLVRSEPIVRTARNKVYPMYLRGYHMQVLERAFTALRFERDRRHFEGLTFAMPREAMPELKEMIQRFFREVATRIGASTDREEVCQLHVTMFPLSQWRDKAPVKPR